MNDDIVTSVLNIVQSSERRMPAHFTSGNGRSKTFLVDFDGLTEEDEYEMASQAWHNIPPGLSEDDTYACLKIGEDIMVGCFILARSGYSSKINNYRSEIESRNKQFLNLIGQFGKAESTRTLVDNYFHLCTKYGNERAKRKGAK